MIIENDELERAIGQLLVIVFIMAKYVEATKDRISPKIQVSNISKIIQISIFFTRSLLDQKSKNHGFLTFGPIEIL
jgi:hypothetical protein